MSIRLTWIIAALVLVAVIAGGVWYLRRTPEPADSGQLDAALTISEEVSISEKVAAPTANSLETTAPTVNPLDKTNPFKSKSEYANPFE